MAERRSASVGHVLVVEVGAGDVDEFGGLVLNGFHYFGMTVAGGVDGDAGGEVEELVAVDVGDADAAAGFGHHGIAAGVAGGDEAIIGGDGLLGERAGEGGLELGAELGVVRGAGVVLGFFLLSLVLVCSWVRVLMRSLLGQKGALGCRSWIAVPGCGMAASQVAEGTVCAGGGTSPAGGVVRS